MRLVLALGGNALIRRGEASDVATQSRNVARAAAAIAAVAARHDVIITHGNGPQIGLLALLDASAHPSQRSTLDVMGAETDGMIGYMLERELMNSMGHSRVATLLTQVEVRADDPAFAEPTKPIGPVYSETDARRMQAERGWHVAADGAHWRRVVPSPEPQRIVEREAISALTQAGFVTICAGGGGIPVVRSEGGKLTGIECVIDKDRTSALLADSLEVDALLMLTDVAAVYDNWGKPDAAPMRRTTPEELNRKRFAAGSMGPKVEAACRFVRCAGRRAYIGSLDELSQILEGTSGTLIGPA